jgi:hypothetical protein
MNVLGVALAIRPCRVAAELAGAQLDPAPVVAVASARWLALGRRFGFVPDQSSVVILPACSAQ